MTLFHSCNAWDNGRGKFVIWPLIRELLVPATGAVCRRHQRTPRSPPTRRNTYIYACKWINECKRRGRTVQKEGKKKNEILQNWKNIKGKNNRNWQHAIYVMFAHIQFYLLVLVWRCSCHKMIFFSVLFSPAGLAGNCVCGLVSPMRYHYDSGLVLILLYRMNDFPKAYTMHQNFA